MMKRLFATLLLVVSLVFGLVAPALGWTDYGSANDAIDVFTSDFMELSTNEFPAYGTASASGSINTTSWTTNTASATSSTTGSVAEALGYSASDGNVCDAAGLLDDSQVSALRSRAEEISNQYGCGVYIVTVDDYRDFASTPHEAAKAIFEGLDFGMGSDRNGVLLMLSMEDRDYWILAHGDIGNAAFTDYGKDWLADEFLEEFGDNNWNDGFENYLESSAKMLQWNADGTPLDEGNSRITWDAKTWTIGILFSLGLSAIPAALFTYYLYSKLKSVDWGGEANAYMVGDREQLSVKEDTFLYTTTVRRRLSRNDDNDGGGTTVDSDGYSGSGGKF